MNSPDKTSGRRDSKGASQSRTSTGDKMNSYMAHHQQVARDSFQRLIGTLVPSMMTWLVIGIALALPTGLFVALENVESVSRGWDGAAQISLFVNKVVPEEDSRKLARKLRLRDDISEVDYISRTQALEEFQALSGYGDVLEHLDQNPLPAVIVVRPVEQEVSAEATEALYKELKALPQIEQAIIDLEWVQRLYSMMELGKRMTLALAALLALGVLLVIGNTIRLAIESRRDEIVIVKLVGATNAFVRRPFLYTGLWYGLGGGIVSWLLVSVSLFWLSGPVAELSGLYQSQFVLQGLGFGQTLLLWLASGLLGLAGAWLAVSRHLGSIEPR
ncbi:permease-like cell division protein FtsX [Oceanicoccus sagamiensis]|uniref:Cell division protein FtsX n=1 Tax=Oceanicoccus sagamiensis TaxID=716816 RepID=A0A1X9NJM3_9GAMM|nr:permease-like cell division protein FtsX [Oceanicoccus sagamiensis]ARN74183.1 cell division protein FtsX [Oceanicoccus sagamiensis]